MPEPEVQQLPGGGCLTSYSFCTCPLYFAWVFLSYLMPSHLIGILSLGPCILFFFRVPPPWQQPGVIYIYIYLYTVFWISVSSCFGDGRRVHPKTRTFKKARVAAGCTRKRENLKIRQKKRNPKTRKSEISEKYPQKNKNPKTLKF